MMPKDNSWVLKGGRIFEPAPFGIVGIVNITPDSFYDGGRFENINAAVEYALKISNQGAHILDIGAESSRPNAEAVHIVEEQKRLLPVLSALKKLQPELLISVDTYHADTAFKALEAGADIINDISACAHDSDLMDILVQYKPGYVLMHSKGKPENMQKNPQYTDVVADLLSFFEHHLNLLLKAGLPENRIVIDLGIGFGKKLEHNTELLKNINKFKCFGRPIFIGISMKSYFGDLLNLAIEQRALATQVLTTLMAQQGVSLHRVHNVKETVQTLKIVSSLMPNGP